MSISRRFLKGIGIEDDKVEAIIEAHTEVTSRMQAEIDSLKALKEDAEKLPKVQKELDEATKKIADYEDIKGKYETEKQAFADFKKEVEEKETLSKVKDAYKALLKEQNIDEKRFDAILRLTDFTNLKLNEKGKFDNESEIKKTIEGEWSEYKKTTEDRGAKPETPPAGTGAKAKTVDEILAIKNPTERQNAIAENPGLFGLE